MLVYGSYINKNENLPKLGASVALVDIGVAVFAGMLIIPAMYVAAHNGVQIFTESGALIQGDSLIFNVLPALFATIDVVGWVVACQACTASIHPKSSSHSKACRHRVVGQKSTRPPPKQPSQPWRRKGGRSLEDRRCLLPRDGFGRSRRCQGRLSGPGCGRA